jgi:hypothetical protein
MTVQTGKAVITNPHIHFAARLSSHAHLQRRLLHHLPTYTTHDGNCTDDDDDVRASHDSRHRAKFESIRHDLPATKLCYACPATDVFSSHAQAAPLARADIGSASTAANDVQAA